MREILFRAKTKDDGKWIDGFPVRIYDYGGLVWDMHPFNTNFEITRSVDTKTIGQFVGLTDRNGNKIFEGDIIKIPDDYDEFGHNAGEIYEVYFCCGGFRLKPKYSKARGYWLEDDETVEVIGNIHDNPELLK